MSAMPFHEVERLASRAAVETCWAQWVALGSPAAPVPQRRARSIVDLEALLLLSIYVSGEERRLRDLVAWWARAGSHLTSVQRLRSLASTFPGDSGREAFETFATMATSAGDRRWASHARGSVAANARTSRGPQAPALVEASALWPRLRAGFGVGAKADILVFLLGLGGGRASVKVITFATGYSPVAIRKAATEMARARLIRETEGRPSEYHAPPRPWAELLELYSPERGWSAEPEAPSWRFWAELFAFLVGVMEWSRKARSGEGASPHTLASRARDLIERHRLAFGLDHIPVPLPEAFPGLAAPQGLLETTRVAGDWMTRAV